MHTVAKADARMGKGFDLGMCLGFDQDMVSISQHVIKFVTQGCKHDEAMQH